jgi:hypothetical protein
MDFKRNEDDYVNSGNNFDDDFPPNYYVDNDVLKHHVATNEGHRHSLDQSPHNVLFDTPRDDKENPSSGDDEIMETLQRNIVSRTMIRHYISIQIILVIQGLGNNLSLNQFP